MQALEKLIDETKSYMIAEKDMDMAKMYYADWKDFNQVDELVTGGSFQAAADKINGMDTSPREQAVLALAEEKGSAWVAHYLGWEVA